MKLSETDRENIASKLENENHGLWKALKYEIHSMGGQALFLFLIEDPTSIGEIVTLFQRVSGKELTQVQETNVELSFIEIREGKMSFWI